MIRKAMTGNAAAMPAPIDFTRLGATPREVTLTRAGVAVTIVAGVMAAGAIAAAIGLPIVHVRQTAQAEVLLRDSAVGDARIVAISGPRGEEHVRRVTFAYTADAASFTADATLNQRESRRVAIGDTIGVRYLRSDPRRVWIRGDEPGVIPIAVIPLPVVGLLTLAGLIVWRVQRQRSLLSEGRFAYARVVASKKSEHGARVSYEFTTLSGGTCVARSDTGRRPPEVGSVVPVVYHRDDPRRSALYPPSLVKPAKA
jgi:hypothetical protein